MAENLVLFLALLVIVGVAVSMQNKVLIKQRIRQWPKISMCLENCDVKSICYVRCFVDEFIFDKHYDRETTREDKAERSCVNCSDTYGERTETGSSAGSCVCEPANEPATIAGRTDSEIVCEDSNTDQQARKFWGLSTRKIKIAKMCRKKNTTYRSTDIVRFLWDIQNYFRLNSTINTIFKQLSVSFMTICLILQNSSIMKPTDKLDRFGTDPLKLKPAIGLELSDILITFRPSGYYEVTTYMLGQHSVMNKYIKELCKPKLNKKSLMKNEWARFRSFEDFPKSATISVLKLSANGFYYSGQGTMATCFSCGCNNDKWTNNESIPVIHKKISPTCAFLNGTESLNEAIHEDDSSRGYAESEPGTSTGEGEGGTAAAVDESQLGACGGGMDDHRHNKKSSPLNNIDNIVVTPHKSIFKNDSLSIQESEQNFYKSNENDSQNTFNNYEMKADFESENGFSTPHTRNNELDAFPGSTGCAKYPEYALEIRRLETFATWPSRDKLEPKLLAECGLFATGLADCTKCYFCGGGLRNWDAGDNPWIEHARWFSDCGFVLHKKGQDFVNMCKMAHEFAALDPSDSDRQPNYTDEPSTRMDLFSNQIPNELSELNRQKEPNDLISTSRSAAAKVILDMGYSPKAIDDAIEELKMLRDSTSFSVETIVEFMLTNDYGTCIEEEPRGELNNDTHVTNTKESPKPNDTENKAMSAKPNKTPSNLDESKALKEENERLKQIMVCKICMDNDANIVFLPCGHMVSCGECAHALRKCAVCRARIQGTVRAFPS